MARGENPGDVLTIETTLTYSAAVDFGHASAGKDLVLSIIASGANVGKAQMGANNAKILGKFLSLDKNGVASYMPNGMPLLLRSSAAAIVPGSGLLCAGNGQVKSEPDTATAVSAEHARGQVVDIQSTGANGRILALMP